MTQAVLHEARDDRGVVTLTIDRPAARNAIDADTMGALTDACHRLAADGDVRVVVLTGAGEVFSAGADLAWMSAMASASFDENVTDARRFEAMLSAVHELPVPVVARVNGAALGGAAGLVACADVVVAVEGASFGFTEVRLGLAPAMISAYVVPRIGPAQAGRWLVSGERFPAATAQAIGLVHEVVAPERLDAIVADAVDSLLAGGPEAQRATKRLLRRVVATPAPADTVDERVELISRLRVGDEGQEGMGAFFERRPPSWRPAGRRA